MKCGIEIFINNQWTQAAEFEVRSSSEVKKGYRGSGYLEYDTSFAGEHLGRNDRAAVSCRYTVNFELYDGVAWPAFLLDLLPSGASRRYWVRKLNLKDGAAADWPLLIAAAANPIGNLRIQEAARRVLGSFGSHPNLDGFDYSDVITKKEQFIEYAHEHGAPVAGSTGAQGDAPKFLLTEDKKGKWHADGALSDELTAKHWLVKFPRGKQESDRIILKNEAAYARVAKEVGVTVHELPNFEKNVLFVSRFDRSVKEGQVIRHGQESLCSLAGVSEFGEKVSQELLCEVLAKYSSSPLDDVKEFLTRDVLNVALGNTDNHARNTAVSKYLDGTIRLSPLFDFAPMILDDQGIPRVCRWANAETAGFPDWKKVVQRVSQFGFEADEIAKHLAKFSKTVGDLPKIMAHCGVGKALIDRFQNRINDVASALGKVF